MPFGISICILLCDYYVIKKLVDTVPTPPSVYRVVLTFAIGLLCRHRSIFSMLCFIKRLLCPFIALVVIGSLYSKISLIKDSHLKTEIAFWVD